MNPDNILKSFSKILSFVNELNSVFPTDNIRLYYKLLKKTPIGNALAINKHIDIFKVFLELNKQVIIEKNYKAIQSDIIFSQKVYLDVLKCLEKTDKETRDVIFKHLIVILYTINPDESLKTAIIPTSSSSSSSKVPSTGTGNEADFLNKFMGKIEQNFAGADFKDPVSCTMNMLGSGLFTELVSNMNEEVSNGRIDITKLLGGVQGMIGNLSNSSAVENDPQMVGMMSMMNGLLGKMNSSNETK